ncbi:MAG TPA: zinc ribbon domain-containing protein [Anaerolineaceae bacterium]|nr:zinc ribbon domain-containing protein [Anaerolineaceae bacterium]
MFCPYCGANNSNQAQFCLNCGKPLPVQSTSPGTRAQPPQPYQPLQQSSAPQQYPPQPYPPQPYQPQPGGMYPYQAPSQMMNMQPASQAVNIWGPFVEYGTRRSHLGWLMDNKGEKTQELIESVRKKFTSRNIPEAQIIEKELVARGLLVEKRLYFLLRRKLVTVGLYITQFGKDLYLSIASYIKPPISNFRVLIAGIIILFAIFTNIILPSIISNQLNSMIGNMTSSLFGGGGRSPGMGGLMTWLCIFGPLGLVNNLLLGGMLIYSFYKWLIEKDFLAILRTKPNEFNEDDLMSMEKAVEQTVRMAIDEIGLDPDDLKPISSGEEKRRLI